MTNTEITALSARTKDAAMTGNFEKFTTDSYFDETTKNPKSFDGMPEEV